MSNLALNLDIDQGEWDDDCQFMEQVWRSAYKPPPILTVSQWADKYRVLSSKAGNESGPWRTRRTPYLREIMDRLGPYDPCEIVVFMKGSQIGGTECGNNWTGYVIDQSPGPMLYVMPNLEDADFTSEQRLDPLIEETPSLLEKVTAPRDKAGGNSRRRKTFPGGILKLVGANSSSGLRSMPARWLYMDEVDEYPLTVGKQGDPIELALVRSRTFWPRKGFMTSSPTTTEKSKIAKWYKRSDQRKYFLPCPKCKHMQTIEWKRIKFQRNDDNEVIQTSVGLECENPECKHLIGEHHKAEWYQKEKGVWRPTARGEPGVVGYHCSALYSPLGWLSWYQIINKFLVAKHMLDEYRDDTEMRAWVNTVLAETWDEDRGKTVPWVEIKSRAATSSYTMGEVPMGGLLLTCGVDTQDDRLEALIRAYGRGQESWMVYQTRLWGDPDTEAPWLQLDELLKRGWPHASGQELRVVSCAIDTGGHRTHAVYNYARQRDPLVIAIKGANQMNKPVISRPTNVDVTWDGETIKDGAQLWTVGSDTIRHMMYTRLKLAEPGPTTMHFPRGLQDEFYKQLVAKKSIVKHVKGVPHTEWIQHYHNAEVHDCELYAYAAAVRIGLNHMDWDQLEQFVRSGTEQIKRSIAGANKNPQSASRQKPLRRARPRFGKRD